MQFSMIYTPFKRILRKSIFWKKWIFRDFSIKIDFQKITVLVTKKHKKSKFFIKLEGMDHKLSKDVFGMFIRFLVRILWEFQNSRKILEIAKKAIKVASEICVFTNDNIKVLKI